jgi:DUF971 family protein
MTQPWPLEIRLKDQGRMLEVDFEGGGTVRLPAEYLRVESPSAEVQGHGPSQKQLVSGVAGIAIAAVEPVGNYAVRLRFDDGHDTGLFSWAYLHQLGAEHATRWPDYLAALAKAGRSRNG